MSAFTDAPGHALTPLHLGQGNRPRSSPSLPTEEEERAGERSRVLIGLPLSPTLSPLVPRRQRATSDPRQTLRWQASVRCKPTPVQTLGQVKLSPTSRNASRSGSLR